MLTQLSSSRNMQIVVDGLPLTDRSVSVATERVEVALEELDDLVVNIGQESHTREHYWATDAQSITSGPYADIALLGRFDGVLDEVEITDGRAPLSSLERLDTHVVAAGLAQRAEVQISYAIGVARPTSVAIETFGTGRVDDETILKLVQQHFDLRPAAIIRDLDLRRPIYLATAAYGHFGREEIDAPWERTDKAALLRQEAGLGESAPAELEAAGS